MAVDATPDEHWAMTSTPPPAAEQEAPTGPRVSHEEMRDLGRLRRSRTDRKVAGVAGGLGRHFDIDPTIIRVAFVVLAIFGGAGLLLYGVAWLLVPEEGAQRARIDIEPSTRAIVLIAFAAIAALMMIGDSWGVFGFPWPLAVLGIVVLSVMLSRKDRSSATVSLTKDAAPPNAPAQAWQPAPPPVPRPYRGPRLFWATLALIAVALGVLRIVELSGTGMPNGAYPALALAICGGMLVLGAWYGRAGGVLFVGILAGLGLGLANVSMDGFGAREHYAPTTSAAVDANYRMGIGEIELDLSEVSDLQALDGRTIRVHGNVVSIEVIVPDGMDVTATGVISGGGDVDIFGENKDGENPLLTGEVDGGVAVPHLTIDADLDLGTITVRTQ
jgi:phage shock protein PspC (stress-responsive transcriptional regulator)